MAPQPSPRRAVFILCALLTVLMSRPRRWWSQGKGHERVIALLDDAHTNDSSLLVEQVLAKALKSLTFDPQIGDVTYGENVKSIDDVRKELEGAEKKYTYWGPPVR